MGIFDEIIENIADKPETQPEQKPEEQQGTPTPQPEQKDGNAMHQYSDDFVKKYGQKK